MNCTFPALPVTTFVQRESTILALCTGKRVLHLGCVGWTDLAVEQKLELANAGFHASLSAVCDCTGIDIDAATVRQLQERGVFKNVLVGDAEHLAGDAQYDLIVAGDLIEHLSNPGLMLEGARKILQPGGRLIISTPNAFGLPAYLRLLAGCYAEGAQHVLNFNWLTIQQLLARHGWRVTAIHGCYQRRAANSLWFPIVSLPFRLCPRPAGTLLLIAQAACPCALITDC